MQESPQPVSAVEEQKSSPSAVDDVAPVELDLDEDVDGDDPNEAAELAAAADQQRTRGTNRNAISCTHPRGVKPLGNQLFDNKPSIRISGFGLLGRMYTDASLLDLLRTQLVAADLIALNRVSRALYILANEEEVWREMVLARWEGAFRFKGDWKSTYAFLDGRQRWAAAHDGAEDGFSWQPLPTPLKFDGFYSDEIFQSFYCAHIDLMSSFGDSADNIPRVHYTEMSAERFRTEFGQPNRPVIITGMMEEWPCYGPATKYDATRWTRDNWLRMYGETVFKIGRFTMPLRAYFEYMDVIASDESPLYLFDSKFGEKIPALLDQYSVPEYFRSDFFNLLNGDAVRPSFRWILVGPPRSGSTWHKDPNHTSAWNALISGEKKWIMYPPDVTPPGIFPSDNGAEVTTPISVAEWFINNYQEHRTRVDQYEEKRSYDAAQVARAAATAAVPVTGVVGGPQSKKAKVSPPPAAALPYVPGPVEATCRPGEIIFIPNGWWHTALNFTPSFAVTQNYVNEENIFNVCDFLASEEGERERNLELLAALETKLAEQHPEVAAKVEEQKIAKEIARVEREEEENRKKNKKKSSLWERLTS